MWRSTDVCMFIMRLTPFTSCFPSLFNSLITFALGNKHGSLSFHRWLRFATFSLWLNSGNKHGPHLSLNLKNNDNRQPKLLRPTYSTIHRYCKNNVAQFLDPYNLLHFSEKHFQVCFHTGSQLSSFKLNYLDTRFVLAFRYPKWHTRTSLYIAKTEFRAWQ
jgi:hypothetical protein